MGKFGIHFAVLASSLLCVLAINTSNAQIGREIQQRLQQRTIQAVDTAVTDHKRPGRVEPSNKKLDSSPSPGAPADTSKNKPMSMQDLFGGMQKATYESSYTLTHEMKVEMRSQDKPNKKEEITNMNMFYGENCTMSVVVDEKEKDQPRGLMDFKNNTTIMLNDEDMTAMAISLNGLGKFTQQNPETTTDGSEYTITKTGNTKTIAGYLCEEVIMESDETKMNVWYTDDLELNMSQVIANSPLFGKSKGAPQTPEDMTGTMLEMIMVEKTGDKGTFHYLVKEVIVGDSVIDVSKYTFQ